MKSRADYKNKLHMCLFGKNPSSIHDDINKCAMGVGWAQRLIVPTISQSVEFVHIGGHDEALCPPYMARSFREYFRRCA